MHDFHEVLSNAPVLVVVQRGNEHRFQWLNPSAQRALGERNLTGKTPLEVFPEFDSRKVDATVDSGQPYVGISEPITIDWSGTGKIETRYVTFVRQPTRAEDGTVDGCVTVAIDVTADVMRRDLNPRDRAWIEAALDGIAAPVVFADPPTRRMLFVNAAARRLSRDLWRRDFTPGGADAGYCTDTAGSPIAAEDLAVARAARGEVVDAMEIVWHAPFGVIPLVCFAESIPATGVLPSVVVVSMFDLSVARGVERELLEELNTRDEFIGLVAHELRTPLTALRLQAQSLLRKNPEAPGIAAVDRATSRMQDLVEQLLTAAQLRDLGIRLAPEEVNLCELVDEVIGRLRTEAQRVGCSIVRCGATDVRGRWDRLRLEYVLGLLIGNALRFGADKPVSVRCLDLGERVSVAVSDGGIGVDPADHERIFRRFGRAAPASHFGGLGLGLWLARDIVTRMGGSIGVSSTLGQGATFTVELPKGVTRAE